MIKKNLAAAVALAATVAGIAVPATAAQAATPVPAVAAKAPTLPVLKAGSRGAAVTRVQHILRVKATGVFDKATVAAVKTFQKAHHLRVDGQVSAGTWKVLLQVEAAQIAAAKAAAAARALAIAKDNEVSLLDDTTGHALTEWLAKLSLTDSWAPALSAADRDTLRARAGQVRADLAALDKKVRAVTNINQVEAVGSAGQATVDAELDAIDKQLGAGYSSNPAAARTALAADLAAGVADQLHFGFKLDPAIEQPLRKAYLDASYALDVASLPMSRQEMAADPFTPAGRALIESLMSQARDLPEGDTWANAGTAWENYVYPDMYQQ